MRWRSTSIAIFASGLFCGLMLHLLFADSIVNASAPGASDKPGPPPPACDADIAPPGGDGMVNVIDLLAVINSWGECVDDDQDNDGWTVAEGDCDDNNPNVHPGAPEVCNGIDDDCDDQIDERVSDTGGNTCALATNLGTLAGDICNGATLNASGTLVPAGDTDYFRAFISEESDNVQDVYGRVTLTVHAGATSPLRLTVWCNTCGGQRTTSVDVNPGQSGHLIVRSDDDGFGRENSFDLYVQVRSVSPSVSICGQYQLTVSCTPGTAQLLCN